jgi:hypothetical protein
VLVPAVILPPAPTNLEACHESGSPPNVCNYLSWTGSSGVMYNVYRNSSSPVPIDAGHRITSGITETEYTDCGRYKNYYYAVTAVNENGESNPSNEAQASEPCGFAMAITLPVLNAAALIRSPPHQVGAGMLAPRVDFFIAYLPIPDLSYLWMAHLKH